MRPILNDVSTDLQNPPEFTQNPKLNPLPPDFIPKIQGFYTDLHSLELSKPKDEVFKICLEAAGKMPRWQLSHSDSDSGIIEGVAVTKLLRFKDDFIIRVTSTGDGSKVDMRSKSRIGLGDQGANAARIKEYFQKVKEEME